MGKAHNATVSPKKVATPSTMPGSALAFAMTAAQKITPDTLGGILTKATESEKGSEYERLWGATSWSALWSGTKVIGTGIWHAGQTTKFLTNRQGFINEVMNDDHLPQFIEQNKPLMSCLLRNILSENAERAKHPSRSVEEFIDELPKLVSQLQQRGCLKDVTDIEGMVHTIFDTLIKDAASLSAETDKPNLFNASLEISEKFLEMTAAHPVAARNIIGRFATSSESPSYQADMANAISTLKIKKSIQRIGPDGRAREDFTTLCTQYRENPNKAKRMFLDTPVEASMHQYDFSNLTMEANTIAANMHIEEFVFKEAKLMAGFPPEGACFLKCDFNLAELEDGISFRNCIMDTETFKTLLPSLREAKAKFKEVDLEGMTLVGDTSKLDLSHIDVEGIKHHSITQEFEGEHLPSKISNVTPNPDTPLSSREIDNRKSIEAFSNNVWRSLSAPVKQELIQQTPKKGMLDLGQATRAQKLFALNLQSIYGSISKLSDVEQTTITHALMHNTEVVKKFAKELEPGKEPSVEFKKHIEEIKTNPEFRREYIRAKDKPELDPFTNGLLANIHSLSDNENQILKIIAQENVKTLSQLYDKTSGSPEEKAEAVLQEVKTSPRYKFRKEVREYNPKSPYFQPRHIESMRTLFIDIGCGAFLDTVEYQDAHKNPPTRFGTAFQKTICFLFPNLRNLFGVDTKFGKTLASRSFTQICKLVVYSITHPQKMWRTIKDSAYVMDQIGWITWKEPRDIAGAQQELVTKLVKDEVVGQFLGNEGLPSLAFSVTSLFADHNMAKASIATGQKFYAALHETGVVRNVDSLIKGPQLKRNKIMAPFLTKVIKDNILQEVNSETVAFLTDTINKAIGKTGQPVVSKSDIQALVGTGTKLTNLLKKHNISEEIEALLSASNTERLEMLKKTIHNPNDLSDIIRSIEEMQRSVKPIMEKAALQWSTRTKEKVEGKGVKLWYEPDQDKFNKIMAAKKENPNAAIDLNKEFNSCSFGHIRAIGTKDTPEMWTNMTAKKLDMWGSTLSHVVFDGSQFSGYSGLLTSKWYFKGASFDHAKMDHCSLKGVQLKQAYMQDVHMAECVADDLDLTKANMQYAVLQSSDFKKTSFKEANFYGSYIHSCRFEDTDLSHTKCAHAVFKSEFHGNTNFEGANLENATFSGSKLNGNVNFRRAILTSVNFDNVEIAPDAKINLEGAIVTVSLLNKLKAQYTNNLENLDKVQPIPDAVLQDMREAEQSRSDTDSLAALASDRGQKRLKGIL